jgi:N-acetylglutamate synthase-like GNAT family acetyltransferase
MEQTTTEHPLWLRPARPDDLQRLGEMLERCSPETLYRRFHGTTHEPMRREIERVAGTNATDTPGTDRHRSWVAVSDDGAVRGTGTLAWRDDTPEIALLVEDAWFRRGIGRSLLDRLAGDARRSGAEAIVAWVQGDNLRAVKFLRATAPGARIAFDSGELAVTISLTPATQPRTETRTRRDAA